MNVMQMIYLKMNESQLFNHETAKIWKSKFMHQNKIIRIISTVGQLLHFGLKIFSLSSI